MFEILLKNFLNYREVCSNFWKNRQNCSKRCKNSSKSRKIFQKISKYGVKFF